MNKEKQKRSGTKLKILKAATTLFSERGYKGTSVRDIASEVDIKQSALYNHFRNKEDIFLEVSREIFNTPFPSELDNFKEYALGGKTFVSKFAQQYKLVTFDKASEKMFRLLMIELLQNKELREQFMTSFHDKNIKLLSEAFFIMMQNSLVRSGDPMIMAYEFISTLFYIRLQVTLLRFDSKSTDMLSTQFEKHVDYFWESIKI